MAQLDALRLSSVVRRRMMEFASYDRWVRDQQLAEVCANLWSGSPDQGGLVSDLWVEGAFPAEVSGHSLGDLVYDGGFNADLCSHLDKSGAVPRNRPLYTHQHSALVRAGTPGPGGERGAVVVTAPTGAGKTESFLLPVLNDLFDRHDDGSTGVKCILLYPMNALVNDQVDRIHSWLKGQNRVRLFHFTSETPEDFRRANTEGVPRYDRDLCRVRTRQEARGLETADGRRLGPDERGRVPDIIVTNYSMLEYMLCRPQDAVFFGPALRSLVLDEAHLYTGTLAAEITLLLRRLFERCGVASSDVLQMATSATIGTGSAEELQTFAATLFSKDQKLVHVVQGQPTRIPLKPLAPPVKQPSAEEVAGQRLDRSLLVADRAGAVSLAVDAQLCDSLRTNLQLLVSPEAIAASSQNEDRPAALLRETLAAAPLIHRMEAELWEHRRLSLNDLTHRIWNSTDDAAVQATTTLLQLGASARSAPGDYPLVPHRIHMLVRPTDGLYVCLNSDCTGPANHKLNGLGAVGTGVKDRCPHCLGTVLALHRCDNCGEWVLSGALDKQRRLKPAPWPNPRNQYFTLNHVASGTEVTLNPLTGRRSGAGASGVKLVTVDGCPNCGSDRAELRAFAAGTPLTLAVLAETALAELPPYPSPYNQFLPAQGRRMLAFSDSRQEAARLGPRLTRQHEIQVVRSAFLACLEENAGANPKNADAMNDLIAFCQSQLATPATPSAVKQMWMQQLQKAENDLKAMNAGGSVTEWAGRMSGMKVIAELMDPEVAEKQNPADWSQTEWERNQAHVTKRIPRMLAEEFARRSSPLEKFGMVEVTYPGIESLAAPAHLLGLMETADARQRLSAAWPDLLRGLCDTLRAEGVVYLGEGEENIVAHGSVLTGRWCAEEQEWGNAMIRFIGRTIKSKRRRFAEWILTACGIEPKSAEEQAPELLRAAFRQLLERAVTVEQKAGPDQLPWIERSSRQAKEGPPADAVRLRFPELALRKPAALYRCGTTGHIWPRSVLGCAPEMGSNQSLIPVTDAELDADVQIGLQRKEMVNSRAFRLGLWAEEHSAQLAPKENRRLQDLFKSGIRNILSATTTLELGIDIGGLNAVLMSNVPPGKANYLQRAGRAGRRADGSSMVITFARSRPFDQAVFQSFGDYLGRPLRKPIVFLDRVRLVRRHLHSFLLGEFFASIYPKDQHTGTMNAFGNMGYFCGVPLPDRWKEQVEKPEAPQPDLIQLEEPLGLPWWNPALKTPGLEAQFLSFLYWLRDWGEYQYREAVERIFRATAMAGAVDNWSDLISAVIHDFDTAIAAWRDDYDTLILSWYVADKKPHANALRYQLSCLYELTVIEALADRQFLPHYGFPIGVQKLRVIAPDEKREGKIREEDQYRLERGSLMALREYVPGSQLLAGGKLVASRGLLKHWTGANLDNYLGLRGKSCKCENGHFYYWTSGAAKNCPICGGSPAKSPGEMLFPKHGFSSAAWDPPRWSTEVERIGQAQTATITFTQQPASESERKIRLDFGGVAGLKAEYRENGELLVYNAGEHQSGFAICLKCGYADSEVQYEKGKMDLPPGFEKHAPLASPNKWDTCLKGTPVAPLRNQVLAAREITDVLMLDFSVCLGQHAQDEALVTTLAYALQRAGAQLLELDSRELGVLPTVPAGEKGNSLGVVIYDNVPGGAGHVQELLFRGKEWLDFARQVLFVNEAHHTRCDTACPDCLLSFDGQDVASRNLFDRRLALGVLSSLLEGRALPPKGDEPEESELEEAVQSEGPGKSREERKKAAQERLRRRP